MGGFTLLRKATLITQEGNTNDNRDKYLQRQEYELTSME